MPVRHQGTPGQSHRRVSRQRQKVRGIRQTDTLLISLYARSWTSKASVQTDSETISASSQPTSVAKKGQRLDRENADARPISLRVHLGKEWMCRGQTSFSQITVTPVSMNILSRSDATSPFVTTLEFSKEMTLKENSENSKQKRTRDALEVKRTEKL